MTDTDLLAARQRTHGEAARTARVRTMLMAAIHDYWAGPPPTPVQAMAIDMITVKLARIASGDASFADHWRDIAGYAEMAAREMGE